MKEFYFDYLDFFLHNCSDDEMKEIESINFFDYFVKNKKCNIDYHFCFNEVNK